MSLEHVGQIHLNHCRPCSSLTQKQNNKSNYYIGPTWCKKFPMMIGIYGTGHPQDWNSFVAMQVKGGMDQTLLLLFLNQVIIPCYPIAQPKTVQNLIRKIEAAFDN